jgi:hypothetical protein
MEVAQQYEDIEDIVYFYDNGELTRGDAVAKLEALGMLTYDCNMILEEE